MTATMKYSTRTQRRCRLRLFDMFIKAFPQATVGYLILAELILERNIICGDSLEIMKKKETERRRDHE